MVEEEQRISKILQDETKNSHVRKYMVELIIRRSFLEKRRPWGSGEKFLYGMMGDQLEILQGLPFDVPKRGFESVSSAHEITLDLFGRMVSGYPPKE